MKQLTLGISLIYLVIATSGCLGNLSLPKNNQKAKINYNLPHIDSSQVRYIADISSIAFEWNMIRSPEVIGYIIYRSNVNDKNLRKIATINDRYSTHYVDEKLKPNSIYLYQFSALGKNGTESQRSELKAINTLNIIEPISYAHAMSNLPGKIKIIWRPHPSKLVSKYVIYKHINNSWKEIGQVPNRLSVEFIDKKLKNNASHSYKVYAMTFDNILSKSSQIVSAKTKPLPMRVTKIGTTRNLPKKIDVVWSTREEDIAYFNVYRSTKANTNFSLINKTNETKFTDIIPVDGMTYFYKISITDTDGLESETHNITGMPGQTLPKPLTPFIRYTQLENNQITVRWDSRDTRITQYTLIKKIKNNDSFLSSGEEQTFTNLTQREFIDTNIAPNTTYKYYVYGIDDFGISSNISPESIVVTPKLKK